MHTYRSFRRKLLLTSLVVGLVGCGSNTVPTTETTPSAATRDTPDALVARELDRLVAEGGTAVEIVVLDPRDGRVVAMQSHGVTSEERRAGRSVTTGSTVKPLTIAVALEAGLDPSRRFDGEGGEWRADVDTILRDHEPRESFDARDVVVRSSNVGAAKIVEAVGEEVVLEYLRAAGATFAEGSSALELGAGIGTSMRLTDLAAAYAVFANGGVGVAPTAEGSGARRAVVSPATAATVLSMLEAATSDDGTGRAARVVGHRVGGKTGTTSDGAAVFVGIAPLDAPRFVVAIRVERSDGAWGGAVAAPAFSRLLRDLLTP
jgi:cell division protein FtsI (penicillin-binding protein 3)